MVWTRLAGAFVWVLVAGAGCAGSSTGEDAGNDCVELCEKGKREGCPNTEQIQCETNCLGEDVRVEETGCRSRYNELLRCTSELDDICSVQTSCDAELDELRECYVDFCTDNPRSSVCNSSG